MQEETSLQVSPFLSVSQLKKAFESIWDLRLEVPARSLIISGPPASQAFEFDMRRVLMTTKYIMNMFSISKLKFKIDE